MKEALKTNIKAIFFDLDGTLYFKNKAIEGAIEVVTQLKKEGYICRFLTNADSVDEKAILDKLCKMGFDIELSEIYTPVTASVNYLKGIGNPKIYTLVCDEILSQYSQFECVDNDADFVVIGDCRDRINFEELNKVFRIIHEKAEILALQKGRYFYDANGINMDTGAVVTMMEYAANKKAKILGKPDKDFFNILIRQLQLKASEILIIGDDKTTDIKGAKDIGAQSALVRTGKYKDQIAINDYEADYIIDSVKDIKSILSKGWME